jgi:hypothetical protein
MQYLYQYVFGDRFGQWFWGGRLSLRAVAAYRSAKSNRRCSITLAHLRKLARVVNVDRLADDSEIVAQGVVASKQSKRRLSRA